MIEKDSYGMGRDVTLGLVAIPMFFISLKLGSYLSCIFFIIGLISAIARVKIYYKKNGIEPGEILTDPNAKR